MGGKNIFSCQNKGFFHDHLFIPDGLEGRVLEVLEELVLSASAGAATSRYQVPSQVCPQSMEMIAWGESLEKASLHKLSLK